VVDVFCLGVLTGWVYVVFFLCFGRLSRVCGVLAGECLCGVLLCVLYVGLDCVPIVVLMSILIWVFFPARLCVCGSSSSLFC
jgi:hypothetical protein